MKKIALISNEIASNERLRNKLESSGFSVLVANNGHDGLRLIETGKPDLIMIDVLLPGLTGYAILDILKAKRSRIPVLVISGMDDMVDNLAAQNIAGLLIKPINLNKMLMHIDSIFKLQKAAEAIPRSIEDVWKSEERLFDKDSWRKIPTTPMPDHPKKIDSVVDDVKPDAEISNCATDEISKPLVLVIDDEDDFIILLTDLLEANNFRVISSINGEDGLNLARRMMPNVILLDIMLPIIDGFQVCRLLKFNKKYRTIPIIMMTARQGTIDTNLAEAAGADSFINKPFDSTQLINELNRLIPLKK